MNKTTISALLLGIAAALYNPSSNAKDVNAVLDESVATNVATPTWKTTDTLELKLTDPSVNPPYEFTLIKKIPDFLKNYQGQEKEELFLKYEIMWRYGIGVAYFVIEEMRLSSSDSQRKIKHFGFEEYLRQNFADKVTSIDYAFRIHIEKREPDQSEIHNLAIEAQKLKKAAGDKSPAPIIGINPVNYLSEDCINAREKWFNCAISNDLTLLSSKKESYNYGDLIRNSFTLKEYIQYLSDVIKANNLCFKAVKDSLDIPYTQIWAQPFASLSISKETKNADLYLLKLCVGLVNRVFGTSYTEDAFAAHAGKSGAILDKVKLYSTY